MNILEKSSNGLSVIPLETKLLSRRVVFIEGKITDESASEFIKNILYLVQENPKEPINVIITHSEGGSISAGLAMYEAIQGKTPIHMYCTQYAYSMAAVLFASGNHGRFLFPNAKLMLHEPLINDSFGGSASDINRIAKNITQEKNRINQLISKHTGKTVKEVTRETKYDHYFSAQESIEFGLADKEISFNELYGGL